ncbi:MAG: methyltransferase domain-containing protein [Burkholderiaceae bacterium]|nr:methyltransferase domain-containing protein [Burkholderiaceae bacterium]
MSDQVLSLPESACAYEIYDPQTLEPANDSTYIRLMELGWRSEEFSGKSVLDIGANSGILSVYAHQLGASKVHSTDVQKPLVEFFSAVVERHGLPITVERRGFDELDPQTHGADIVCLMEVLHWLVDQGGSVADAIAHAARLTRDILYLETPWDVREPSIALKGIVREDQYNIELIVRELSRHFRDVRIVRFMTYFGAMKDSKRVLLRASGRREMSLPLVRLGDANLVQVPMVRGPNQVELVTTPGGPKVLKRLPVHCALTRLDEGTGEALCAHLAGLRDPVLVPPERIGGRFVYRGPDQRDYMLFPFVGRLRNFFPTPRAPETVPDAMEVAVALRKDLRQVPFEIVAKLRAVSGPVPAPLIDSIPGDIAAKVAGSDVGDLCRGAAIRMADYDRQREDAVTHGDVQIGNMVLNPAGRSRIVDLDLMRSGTPYSDVLSCAIYNGADAQALKQALAAVAAGESRPLEQFDIDFSVAQSVAWLRSRCAADVPVSEGQLNRYLEGLRAVAGVMGDRG